jgi:hypothetical protein
MTPEFEAAIDAVRNLAPQDNEPDTLYVCHEQPDRENPRARGRFAVRQEKPQGQEVGVITLSGYKVGHERSPQDWAYLFSASIHLQAAATEALHLLVEMAPVLEGHQDERCARVRMALAEAIAKGGAQ